MGSIPGPIIRFRFDPANVQQVGRQMTTSLQSQFQAAGKNVSANFAQSLTTTVGSAGKKTADQFASAWATAAAKLRSSLTAEKTGLSQVIAARKQIISLAERDVAVLSKKNLLTKSELSALRAATLEIERQKSALSGTGGLTSGTRSVVQQLIQGVTARAGSYGGGFGSFAGLRVNEPLGKFAEEAEPAHLALLGIGTAAVAAAAALGTLAIKGGKFAIEMQRMAEKSGISIDSVVKLRSVSKALDVDFDTVTRGFKKFDTQITYAMGASLPHASYEAVRAAKIFSALGVDIQKAAADPMTALTKLTTTLGQLPDGAVKTAVAVQLFGKAGQELIPVLKHWQEATEGTKKSSQDLAKALGTDVTHSADALQIQMVNFDNETKALEVTLAQKLIPALVSTVSWFTRVADAIGHPGNTFADVTSAVSNQLRAQKLQFSATGAAEFQAFLHQYQAPNAPLDTMSKAQANAFIGDPAQALRQFQMFMAVNGGFSSAVETSNAFLPQAGAAKAMALTADQKEIEKLKKQLAGFLVMDSTGGRGGRGGKTDFSEPLFLGTALEKEWTKYQEAIKKSNEALKKHTELMEKLSADTFAKNSFMTLMLGPIGIAADSPDKTGAGIQKFFDKINEKNAETAKKAADEWKRQFEKLKESVGNLFDAMLQGSRSFADALKRMVETALLAPIKHIFTTQIAKLLQGLETRVQKSATPGKSAHGVGGFFSKILNALGLGAPPNAQPIAQQNVGTLIAGSFTVLGGTPGAGLPKPNNFLDMFSGGGTSSLSSLAGIGGLSLALAGAGGMAIAGSGGSPIAAAGGVISSNGSGGNGGILGSLQNAAKAMAANPLKTGLGGAALLATGIATHNGAAMALGIGSLAGAGLTELSKLLPLQGGGLGTAKMPSKLAGVLGVLGQAAPGIGMMFAGNQTGGFGGAAMGALGGAMSGAAIGTFFAPGIGTAIGAGIGAIAGALMGAFGKKDNTKAWNNGVQKAMNNQRITQPLSENFAFAATNAMASTFGTTFTQGPGGFSNSTLPANTPFWANAILGTPHGTKAQIAWNALINGINPNSPFFGGTNTSPFNGGPLVNGLRLPGAPTGAFSPNSAAAPMSVAPSVVVHLTIPGYVDKNGVAEIAKAITPHIQKAFNGSIYQGSSGAWKTIRRAGNLP